MPLLEASWIVLVVAAALISGCVACVQHVRYTERVRLAEETLRLARDWERQGQVQRAYRAYSQVCDGAVQIDRADIARTARERALTLYRTIVGANDDALRALDAYRDRVGRYPDNLEAVRGEIPAESLAAFRGFQYERKGDSDLRIVTGLYDPALRDRRRRSGSRFRGSVHQ